MKPGGWIYECQVCGETRQLVMDKHLLRCFDCIDAGRYALGTRPAEPISLMEMLGAWVRRLMHAQT